MERINGFLKVDDFKIMSDFVNGKYSYGWLQNEDSVFLFKNYDFFKLQCYKELIYSKLATKIGIPNVGYDLATYLNHKGVITKKYTTNPTVSIKSILEKEIKQISYLERNSIYYYYHIDFLDQVLKKWYGERIEYDECKIHQSLLLYFISQVLFANSDSNTSNIEIDEKTLELLPLYDFGNCGRVRIKKSFGTVYCFLLKRFHVTNITEHPYITFSAFLDRAEKSEIEMFMMYLENLQSISLDSFFQEVEEKINAPILKEKKLKREITTNLKNIDKICNEKRKF